ncbi:molybdate ABC transporter substrate-binding protein [Paracoccus jeotgali]|uniref:molybdate ABC transporter substrate-binding protein n=1 Tax=Paracoccus jeotgali TaxID=2065379 RepID=UPI0028A6F3AF|nr:molybdate ABC transporter substrate-binding protein [Paracoccus jeotgali]
MRVSLPAIVAASLLALPATADQVHVFAAASMRNALDAVAADYMAKSGDQVVISYAGSNALARQIIDGAPADIFISANESWMDEVEAAGLIADDLRRDLLQNTLVLVAGDPSVQGPVNATMDLAGMLDGGKLAMALVESVPAGQYGKAALEHLGLWQVAEPSVAQADNVRAALALVATGEAPLGIVYATDAKAEPRVHVVGEFPDDSYPPATYPAGLLTESEDDGDRAFFEALSGEAASAIFAEQGFRVVN